MQSITKVLLSALIFVPALSMAQTKVGDCQGQFAGASVVSLNLSSEIKSADQLPKKIFVAQTADYLVSSKNSDLKIWGRQSFITGEVGIVCATLKEAGSLGFSIYAPALIDRSPGHPVGNSFWQFHMTVSDHRAGIWNQKSRFAPRSSDFLARMQESGFKVYGEAGSSTRYQLHFVRESLGITEHLRIRYDLTNDLP